ncbi:probable two-component system sensor histidine kinase (Pho family) [Desulfotalea psychrophila LSv54]|uniref:histidine kinase n=2 Tax=Desulfotalea psychrophila TaxID=84980 RepID=Q6AQP3_DESPS|nr:probable two-component system sensor histidine kinase (Pho family) [Desulfotalea psychrophila LSv54]
MWAMFFAATRELRRSPWATLLPLLCGVLFVAINLTNTDSRLRQDDRQRLNHLLQNYIEETAIDRLRTKPLQILIPNLERLGPLAFIRIIHGKKQLLIAHEKHLPFPLSDLSNIHHRENSIWRIIASKKGEVALNTMTREIDGELSLQAGMISSNYPLYQGLRQNALTGLSLYTFLCLLCGYIVQRSSQAAILNTCKKIGTGNRAKGFSPLPERGHSEAMNQLHRKINQLVEHNSRLMSELQGSLDNVAHDLRTPIARLRSTAEYGLQGGNDLPRLQDALANCLEESEQISAILRIMMSVAEAESGTMRLEPCKTDLEQGLLEAIDLYAYSAEEKQIEVRQSLNKMVYAEVDPIRIRQVWANLLDNALKYGKVGGQVNIELWQDEDYAFISFRDNGMGISQTERDRIWERLYRGDRSRTEKGLGLGLNYVKAVTEAHGGQIEVQSELHRGSCFTVKLPKNI